MGTDMSLRATAFAFGLVATASACGPAEAPAPAADIASAPTPSPTPANLAATSSGGPKRADGFWETSLGSASQQYCVGADSEEKYSLVDELSLMGDCSKKDFKRSPAGWEFETVCEMMGVTTTQKGVISGDFQTNYTITQEVTSSDSGSRKGTIVARRLGDCPAPYKPGDLVTEGMTVNMAN